MTAHRRLSREIRTHLPTFTNEQHERSLDVDEWQMHSIPLMA